MSYKKIQELIQNRENLTSKQKLLLDHIIDNANDIRFFSANQLAQNAKVGKATFFRFLKDIGYEGFNEFRQDLYEYVTGNINSNYWQTHALIKKSDSTSSNFLYTAMEEGTQLLSNMMTVGIGESFDNAVDLLDNAEKIAIIGCRTSKQLAQYFENLLIPLGKPILQLSVDENLMFDKLALLEENTVLFLIAGWPYSTNVVQAGEIAHRNGIPIIFLANSISCSISSFADVMLHIPKSDSRYSLIPFICVLEALTNALFSKSPTEVSDNLNKIDNLLREFKQFTW